MKLFGAHLVKWDVFRLKELCLKGLNAWAEAVRGCQPGPEQQVALANHWDVPVRIWRHDLHNDIDVSSSAQDRSGLRPACNALPWRALQPVCCLAGLHRMLGYGPK